MIGNGIQGTELTVPARLLSRTDNGRIRIDVSDGFSTTTATSGPLRFNGEPPTVRITDPYPDSHLRADVPIVLHGEAFDDTGRGLDDKHLKWTENGHVIG